MVYKFPAIFEQDSENNQLINVTFPDLLGVVTFGEGMDNALEMAKDVLLSMLEYDYIKNAKASSLEETKANFPDKEIIMVEVEK